MIKIYYLEGSKKIKKVKQVKSTIFSIFDDQKKFLNSLTIVFCNDPYLLKINKSYLKHDFYTDIITFSLGSTQEIIGEIYISTERVFDNAQQFRVTFQQELQRVLFHGCLHLCGFKDKTKIEKKTMTSLEDKYLQKISRMIP